MSDLKDKKARFEALVKIGCIACRLSHDQWVEPQIHHLLGIKYRAMGKKAHWSHTIPLCLKHHTGSTKFDPSIHSYPKAFANSFGTQEELLEKTNNIFKGAIDESNHIER